MSLTLGEKLRQAREERGFSLSEVAEQTRISSLYLESIENDDYRILPGGIFNKGFVKSYAKLVGVSEQEALSDYAEIIGRNTTSDEDELKVYRPEVLTDDRSGSSMAPTIVFAVIILAAMTAGVWFLVRYFRPAEDSTVANVGQKANTNTSADTPATPDPTPSDAPEMATLKVEFKALSEPVSLTSTSDGKMASNVVTAGSTATFEPKESLKLSYSKSLANFVQLIINGKTITLPSQPLVPRRNAIEFEINKQNLSQIWTSGAISVEVPPAAPDVNANVETLPVNTSATPPIAAPVATPVRSTPAPKPSVAANTEAKPTPDKKPADTPKPVTMQPKPNTNNLP